MKIHPTAAVSGKARLGVGVVIHPGAVVDDNVEIGDGTEVGPHAVITGYTTIGIDCRIYTGTVIGSPPQDLKYRGEKSFIRIGDRNTLREYITINPATEEGGETVVGSDNLIMAYSHIAHNCRIHNSTVLSNNATLAGHVTIEDHVIMGGMCAVHQFSSLGAYAFLGGCSKIIKDIPPYCLADGYPARVYGVNRVGLNRHAFSAETIKCLEDAYRFLLKSNLNISQAVENIRANIAAIPEIQKLLQFIADSQRGLAISRKKGWKRLV